MYQAIKIEKGSSGWGGPLVIQPTEKKHVVLCVTGGDLHPIAQRIAELSGMELVNGFKTGVADDTVAVAVVDCGGTARCGVYPKKRIPTVNVLAVGKSGPLAAFITEDIYVSDVKEKCITVFEGEGIAIETADQIEQEKISVVQPQKNARQTPVSGNFFSRFGKGIGNVVGIFYQAGRDSVNSVMNNIIPFMAFVSMIVGIILYTGIGDFIAHTISPYAGSLGGLVIISLICAIPLLSPVLGPGAVIAQVIGVLIGVEIARGSIPPQYALPAFFAIDSQVGCDFIPVGLSLAEAKAETVEVGVPAVLFTRLVTGPLAVVIAYFASMGLFQS
jgi:glucitol/sorbitol PTS system EIIB component